MGDYHFIKKPGSLEAENAFDDFTAVWGQTTPKRARCIVTLGGDGTLIWAIKKVALKLGKPVFPLNCGGTVGFLANEYLGRQDSTNLRDRISEAIVCTQHPLEFDASFANGSRKKGYAVNDVYVHTPEGNKTIRLIIRREPANRYNTEIEFIVSGNGLVIATPPGSTAYMRNIYGPVQNLDSKRLTVAPIAGSGMLPEETKAREILIKAWPEGTKGHFYADSDRIGRNLQEARVSVSDLSYRVLLESETINRRNDIATFERRQLLKLWKNKL